MSILNSLWERTEEPAASKQPNRVAEVRKMAGFSGEFDKAGENAPDSTSSEVATPTNSKPTKRGRPANQPVAGSSILNPQPSQVAIDLAAQKEAIDKIAKEMMKDVAGMPYEVWAFIAADPALALSKDEEKELSDAYFLVAQSLSLGGMPKWLVLPLFLVGRNAKIMKGKMSYLRTNEERKAVDAIEKGKIPR